jgi:hypothetical protein
MIEINRLVHQILQAICEEDNKKGFTCYYENSFFVSYLLSYSHLGKSFGGPEGQREVTDGSRV